MGGGGGGGEVGAQNFVPSAAFQEEQYLAAIGFHDPLFLSSTNSILPLKLLLGYYLVNLEGNIEMY